MSSFPPRNVPSDERADCPDPDALSQYAEGLLGTTRRAALDAHLPACDACRSVVAGLARAGLVAQGAVAAAPSLRAVRMPRWIPLAAAAVVLVGVAVVLLAGRDAPAPTTAARLDAWASRLAAVRPDLFAGLRPLAGAELTGSEDVLRGGVEGMVPAGLVATTRPDFAWTEVAAAKEYRFVLLDAEGERLVATTVRSARFSGGDLPRDLARGSSWVWKVTAVGAALPAEGTCALRIASDGEARDHAEVVRAVAALPDDGWRDLALAHALVRRGFLADALVTARRFAAAHPGDALGDATLASIRRGLAAAARRP